MKNRKIYTIKINNVFSSYKYSLKKAKEQKRKIQDLGGTKVTIKGRRF